MTRVIFTWKPTTNISFDTKISDAFATRWNVTNESRLQKQRSVICIFFFSNVNYLEYISYARLKPRVDISNSNIYMQ